MYKYNMVVLLSSGKINNRLLCELATHPNFLRLMVDMEIFIDRIADMRVNQMNLILEATRQTILKEHAPGENDLYMRTLELGQVQENDFYSHMLITITKRKYLANGYSVVKDHSRFRHTKQNRWKEFNPSHLFAHLKAVSYRLKLKFFKKFF